MVWDVRFTKRAAKQLAKAPLRVKELMLALVEAIEARGPVRTEWPNYSKLPGNRHHCHLQRRARPTYVAVWRAEDGRLQIVEVIYVGTRENAPY